MRLDGHIDLCEAERISGWARDADAPDAALALGVFVGSDRIGGCVANLSRADLLAAGKGRCGFEFLPDAPLAPEARDRLVMRVAGNDAVLVNNHGGPQPDPFLMPVPPAGTRFQRVVLHIGTEKTGSTSLQRFLAVNRDRLAMVGIYVPQALAPTTDLLNHSDLVAAAMADWRLDDGLRIARGLADAVGLARFRGEVAEAFAAEVARAPAACTTLLLSSEHCHSRLLLMHEVAAVRRFLAGCCREIEIWVYLRPQHLLAASQYGMHLLAGVGDAEMLPPLPYPEGYGFARITGREYFDYAQLLSRWSAIFGRARLRPILMEPGSPAGGNVIEDMMRRLGIGMDGMIPVVREATNVSARAQRLLAALNRAMARRAPDRSAWAAQWMAARLRQCEPGRGVPMRPAAIAAFMEQFAAGNEQVRREWFPERESLFRSDPSGPEEAAEEELSVADAVEILVGLLLTEHQRAKEGG